MATGARGCEAQGAFPSVGGPHGRELRESLLEMRRCRGQVRAWRTDSCSEWLTVWGARREQQVRPRGPGKAGWSPRALDEGLQA